MSHKAFLHDGSEHILIPSLPGTKHLDDKNQAPFIEPQFQKPPPDSRKRGKCHSKQLNEHYSKKEYSEQNVLPPGALEDAKNCNFDIIKSDAEYFKTAITGERVKIRPAYSKKKNNELNNHQDYLQIAEIDRVSWGSDLSSPSTPPDSNSTPPDSEIIPDGEHAWKFWVQFAYVFCAEIDGIIVGAVLAFPSVDDYKFDGLKKILVDDTRQVFAFHKAFVHPDYRGKGIGTFLFERMTAKFDEKKAHAFLTVKNTNAAAIKLYENMGFIEGPFIEGYYRPHEHRFVMIRKYTE